jgi:hypothetical protein
VQAALVPSAPAFPPAQPPVEGRPFLPPKGKRAVMVVIVVLGIMPGALIKGHQMLTNVDAFNKLLPVWLKEPTPGRSTPYVRGKVLPVIHKPYSGGGSGVQKDLFWELPSELRPRNPDEVGTVLWLDWEEKPFSVPYIQFTYRIIGIQYVCKVTIIDRATNEKIGEKTFTGSDPRGSGQYSGDKPYPQIVKYLQSLPRKGE